MQSQGRKQQSKFTTNPLRGGSRAEGARQLPAPCCHAHLSVPTESLPPVSRIHESRRETYVLQSPNHDLQRDACSYLWRGNADEANATARARHHPSCYNRERRDELPRHNIGSTHDQIECFLLIGYIQDTCTGVPIAPTADIRLVLN